MRFFIMACVTAFITIIPMLNCMYWKESFLIGCTSGLLIVMLKLYIDEGPEGEATEACILGAGVGALVSAKAMETLLEWVGYTC